MHEKTQLIESAATSVGSAAFTTFFISARFENFFQKENPATFWQHFKAPAILQHLKALQPTTPRKHCNICNIESSEPLQHYE